MKYLFPIYIALFLAGLFFGACVNSIFPDPEKKYILRVLCDSLEDCEKLQRKLTYRYTDILILKEELK